MSLARRPCRVILEPLVRAALIEDLGLAGDLTTNADRAGRHQDARAFRRAQGRASSPVSISPHSPFELVDPALTFSVATPGWQHSRRRAKRSRPSAARRRRSSSAERVALNFLGHLSGIATATARFVAAVEGHKAQIVCTRKTTPGLRAVEKYAVRAGGGHNHRFGLDDAVLIKDNHIAIAGGVAEALRRAKRNVGHLVKIEVEVDSLAQLREALHRGSGRHPAR